MTGWGYEVYLRTRTRLFFIRVFLLTAEAIADATDKVASKSRLARRYIWINGKSVALHSEALTLGENKDEKLYKICAFTLFVKAVVSSDTCFQLNNVADESIRSRTLDGELQTVPGRRVSLECKLKIY